MSCHGGLLNGTEKQSFFRGSHCKSESPLLQHLLITAQRFTVQIEEKLLLKLLSFFGYDQAESGNAECSRFVSGSRPKEGICQPACENRVSEYLASSLSTSQPKLGRVVFRFFSFESIACGQIEVYLCTKAAAQRRPGAPSGKPLEAPCSSSAFCIGGLLCFRPTGDRSGASCFANHFVS